MRYFGQETRSRNKNYRQQNSYRGSDLEDPSIEITKF